MTGAVANSDHDFVFVNFIDPIEITTHYVTGLVIDKVFIIIAFCLIGLIAKTKNITWLEVDQFVTTD